MKVFHFVRMELPTEAKGESPCYGGYPEGKGSNEDSDKKGIRTDPGPHIHADLEEVVSFDFLLHFSVFRHFFFAFGLTQGKIEVQKSPPS